MKLYELLSILSNKR